MQKRGGGGEVGEGAPAEKAHPADEAVKLMEPQHGWDLQTGARWGHDCLKTQDASGISLGASTAIALYQLGLRGPR